MFVIDSDLFYLEWIVFRRCFIIFLRLTSIWVDPQLILWWLDYVLGPMYTLSHVSLIGSYYAELIHIFDVVKHIYETNHFEKVVVVIDEN